MQQRLEECIKRNSLFTRNSRLLLALSGGKDSVALLHALTELGYFLEVAHCNFQLREEESDGDALFVKEFCASLGLKLHLKNFDTRKLQMAGESTQMTARRLRYEWFETLLSQNNLDYLLTAHHADDQIETILYNLAKGSGVAGLRGMKLKRDHHIRPMLLISSEEIMDYVGLNGLKFREDSSNKEDKYARNKIRHQVLPVLKEINPALASTIQRQSVNLKRAERLLQKQSEEFQKRAIQPIVGGFRIPLSLFKEDANRYFLKDYFGKYDGGADEVEQLIDARVGAIKEFDQIIVYRDREYISALSKDFQRIESFRLNERKGSVSLGGATLEWNLSTEQPTNEILKNPDYAWLDADKLEFPLQVRKWSIGDKFQPFGMKGSQLLSDFLSNLKLEPSEKARSNVLCNASDKVIWVIGQRIDEMYKITPNTKSIMCFKVLSSS